MDKKPLLSIIVPVYNVEDYLEECLDSILSQSLKDIEVIVVDDGSTDSSSEIIKKYHKQDNRIKAIFKTNGGISEARNQGLDIFRGKYVTFVDSDDVLLDNDIYENVVSLLESRPDIDVVQYDVVFKWNSEYEHKRKYPFREYTGVEEILSGYLDEKIHMSCWDKVFRRKVFEEIRFPKGDVSEDIAIIPQIMQKTGVLYTSDFGCYGYRYRIGSISTSVPHPAKIYSILRSYNKFLSLCMNYASLRERSIKHYSSLIWNYTAVMRRNHKSDLTEYFDQPVFMKIKFSEWLKNRGSSYPGMLKSFLVCVRGVRVTCRFQSFFSR